MYLTSGRLVVSATSRAAKTGVISNPRLSMDGSGLQTEKSCHPQTIFPKDGLTTHGRKLVTRKPVNLTTLNSTSTVPLNPACLYLTTFTTMVLHGTMLLAITKNPSFVKTLRSF